MAEATDRPQGAGPAPSHPKEAITTSAGTLGVPETAAAETYRPLSLLALLSFGLAVLYALVVLIGAAVALFGRIPWLMPGWSFLLPLAALALCWAAAMHIRNSEGTLSGLAFTTWGIRLTILVALTYGAYYAATFFAVRGQAVDTAERFFEQLKQGHKEQAYLMAQKIPTKDMDSAELRDMVEARFNNPPAQPGAVGAFSNFCQAQYVRFLEMDGPKANIALRGVSEWEHSKGGYRVVLKYHIATTLAEFELNLETFAPDRKPGEPKGRQWQVVLPSPGPPESLKPTPLGHEVMDGTMRTSRQFATSWADKVNRKQWIEAYLDTLPPSERSRILKGRSALRLLATAPLSGSAALGVLDAANRALLASGRNLESGKLIHLDPKTFWTGPRQRDEIIQRVRNTFKPGSAFNLTLPKAMPLLRESDGRTTVFFDAVLLYLDDNGEKPQYSVEGQLAVTAEGSNVGQAASAWYIESLNVRSGRTPPDLARQASRRGP